MWSAIISSEMKRDVFKFNSNDLLWIGKSNVYKLHTHKINSMMLFIV